MHDGHRDRLRKKFITNGISALEDHEIVELFLYYSIPRKNTNEIAHTLMNYFGSISAIIDAPTDSLLKIKGVGINTAVMFKLIPHMFRIYMDDKHNNKNKIINIDNIGDIFQHKFIGVTNEQIMIMILDSKLHQLYCGVLCEGSVNEVNICIKKIIELSLFYNASIVALAHNHPSGIALPSREDLLSTKKIISALKTINVKFIDHIIVADNDYVSLAQSGIWKTLEEQE